MSERLKLADCKSAAPRSFGSSNLSAPTKICRRCKEESNEETGFYKRSDSKSTHSFCKKCCIKARKKYKNSPETKARSNETQKRRLKILRKNPDFFARFIVIQSRANDKKMGFECDLDEEFVKILINHGCFYCGDTDLRITLDRIDNTKGHLKLNVNPCCIRCNYLRRDMPYAAWMALVPSIREAKKSGLFGQWVGGIKKFI